MLTKNGRAVRARNASMRSMAAATVIGQTAIDPRPPASHTLAASSGPEAIPIGACMIGWSMDSSSVNVVRMVSGSGQPSRGLGYLVRRGFDGRA